MSGIPKSLKFREHQNSLSRILFYTLVTVFYCCTISVVDGFSSFHAYGKPTIQSISTRNNKDRHQSSRVRSRTNTELHVILPSPLPALFSGSIAGAVGVGVAYPLDTVKTRTQVLATNNKQLATGYKPSTSPQASGTGAALALSPPANSMMDVANYILRTEGVGGFFGGVQTSMVGQAIIKAVVFAVNAYMIEYLHTMHVLEGNTNLQLLSAAATAGFITSFLSAPVDRIKVLMQAGGHSYEGQDDQALKAVLKTEGWKGLLGRGLFCTMLREVPAYSIYFGVYEALMNYSQWTETLGSAAPLVYGAAAGCACWIPIHPIDVVKTVIQNTEGSDSEITSPVAANIIDEKMRDAKKEHSPVQVASMLYKEHGFGVFWDGLEPRLIRQAVNHATTFTIYETLLHGVFSPM